jgi:ATP-binding cassette subfamily F protein uup
LSYNDQRELRTLPERLQQLEAEKQQIEAQLAAGELYRPGDRPAARQGQPAGGGQGHDALQERLARLAAISAELEGGYARWGELEAQATGN